MPDAIEQHRTDSEQGLQQLLKKLNAKWKKRVFEAIEQYGSVQAIPQEFWEAMKQDSDEEAAAVILALLMGVYGVTVTKLGKSAGQKATIDPGFMRQQVAPVAAELGRTVADDYVDGIRDRMQGAIDQRAQELNELPAKQAAAEVRQSVLDAMSDDQAERVSVTNTTRGVSAAQTSGSKDAANALGIAIDQKWVTERDGKVCPKCSPLNGRPSIEWVDQYPSGPPAHPRCRCKLEPYIVKMPSNPSNN